MIDGAIVTAGVIDFDGVGAVHGRWRLEVDERPDSRDQPRGPIGCPDMGYGASDRGFRSGRG